MNSDNRKIIIIDDNQAIYEDFKKILCFGENDSPALNETKSMLFGEYEQTVPNIPFELDYANQGEAGVQKVFEAKRSEDPYSMAFVDVRMPPGMDGIETVEQIWRLDPDLQIVICTAYSDYSWQDMISKLGVSSDLLILKKPFDTIEVNQLAHSLTQKWNLKKFVRFQMKQLEERVQERTSELAKANDELMQKIKEQERMELELRHAQKLEAVGQLAAGIAHEINTPVQYVGDSLHFLKNSTLDIVELIESYRQCFPDYVKEEVKTEFLQKIDELDEEADLEYIREHIPAAFDRTFDGIERVSTIVKAMKEFAHPDQRTKSFADINKSLENTLTVSRNEYKYIADVETEFGNIPQVECHISDVNQVFLNLIVNAAHAIDETRDDKNVQGKIKITTSQDEENVLIKIKDSGPGIPEEIQSRIFDPFFTTKEVGKGTGQGLAIARSIIVEKHNGALTFETGAEMGTEFTISIPIQSSDQSQEHAA